MNKNTIYIILGALAAWYLFFRKKVTPKPAPAPGSNTMPGTQTGGNFTHTQPGTPAPTPTPTPSPSKPPKPSPMPPAADLTTAPGNAAPPADYKPQPTPPNIMPVGPAETNPFTTASSNISNEEKAKLQAEKDRLAALQAEKLAREQAANEATTIAANQAFQAQQNTQTEKISVAQKNSAKIALQKQIEATAGDGRYKPANVEEFMNRYQKIYLQAPYENGEVNGIMIPLQKVFKEYQITGYSSTFNKAASK